MTKFTKEKLINQIARLYSMLGDYKKAQVNPPSWISPETLADSIEQIEEYISELEAQLDTLVSITEKRRERDHF